MIYCVSCTKEWKDHEAPRRCDCGTYVYTSCKGCAYNQAIYDPSDPRDLCPHTAKLATEQRHYGQPHQVMGCWGGCGRGGGDNDRQRPGAPTGGKFVHPPIDNMNTLPQVEAYAVAGSIFDPALNRQERQSAFAALDALGAWVEAKYPQ
jgi:hypothetical protein